MTASTGTSAPKNCNADVWAALVRAADLAASIVAGLDFSEGSEAALGGAEALDVVGPEVVVRRGEAAADALLGCVREVARDLGQRHAHAPRRRA